MQNLNHLQENVILQDKSNAIKNSKAILLKDSNKISHHESNNLKQNQNNSTLALKNINATQPQYLKLGNALLREELENDVSMMSIGNESTDFKYFLPSSSKLKSEEVAKIFVDDAAKRRLINRELTLNQIHENSEQIQRLTFDGETGSMLVLEIIDAMQDLELSSQPLGSNFLDDTPITSKTRMEIVNWLFRMSRKLGVERHSVYSGMNILDRFVKIKGELFNSKSYKVCAIMSMFIACKWDLVDYPSIEEISRILNINDYRLLHKYENDIVQHINFNLGLPTPILFLRPMSKIKERKMVSHNVSKCFTEICLIDYDLAGHPTHIIAAASYCLTIYLSFRCRTLAETWIPLMQFVFGLDIEDIRPVVVSLAKVLLYTNFEKDMPYVFLEYERVFEIMSIRTDDFNNIIRESQ